MSNKDTISKDHLVFALVVLAGAMGLFYGWQAFWFLTDDAFIAFRYVSNSMLDRGYVWNPAPFQPVEGYTSFLWVLLMDGVWRLTGMEPPESSNLLSLLFSVGTLVLSALAMWRIASAGRMAKWRNGFVALLVLFMVSNRTFLAWSSSGLETGMFTFMLVAWVYVLLCVRRPVVRMLLGGFASALLTLSRPDGLLFCAALVAVVVVECLRASSRREALKLAVLGISPLALVAVHLAWRKSFYGEWLPNTYYAKVSGASPKSGLLYFASFVLEYAVWVPLAVLAWWAVAKVRPIASAAAATRGASAWMTRVKEHGVPFVVVATVVAQFAYYTLIVGGDHFEYRVYNHLVPLVFLGTVWLLGGLDLRPAASLGIAGLFLALSLPVPWTHRALTKDLDTRRATYVMRVPVAPSFPAPLRWYARAFDGIQETLIVGHVCMRHQEHKVFWRVQERQYPSRAEGARIPAESYPVHPAYSVGVPAWTLPNVSIIDRFGLNDYTIARTPLPDDAPRLMAHSHFPPEGYVESFQPNVVVRDGRAIVVGRAAPMTAEEIERIERGWIERIGSLEPHVPENMRQ